MSESCMCTALAASKCRDIYLGRMNMHTQFIPMPFNPAKSECFGWCAHECMARVTCPAQHVPAPASLPGNSEHQPFLTRDCSPMAARVRYLTLSLNLNHARAFVNSLLVPSHLRAQARLPWPRALRLRQALRACCPTRPSCSFKPQPACWPLWMGARNRCWGTSLQWCCSSGPSVYRLQWGGAQRP